MGDPADAFRPLPKVSFRWSGISVPAGMLWQAGTMRIGKALLDCWNGQPAAFIHDMRGKASWRYLVLSDVWDVPSKTAFLLTDQTGLMRLLDDAGAERGFVETSGQVRYYVPPAAFVAIHSKLMRTYAPEFPSRLRGHQFPVMAEKHGLRMPRLEGSLCR
jgi:hypothetical protein